MARKRSPDWYPAYLVCGLQFVARRGKWEVQKPGGSQQQPKNIVTNRDLEQTDME